MSPKRHLVIIMIAFWVVVTPPHSISGCVNTNTCSSHSNGLVVDLAVGPFRDQICSEYYWICAPTHPICAHCQGTGYCFNYAGSTSQPGPGYPCAPCYQLPECKTTTTRQITTTTTAPPPSYQHYLPNTVSKCSSSGMPAYMMPEAGVIVESPNYPIYYDYNADCVWNVIIYNPELYQSIKLYVNSTYFDISNGDYLLVNGAVKEETNPMIMPVRNITIELISDYQNSGKGFSFYIHGIIQPSTTSSTTMTTTTSSSRTRTIIYIFGGFGTVGWSTNVYKITPDTNAIIDYNSIDSQYGGGEMNAVAIGNGSTIFYKYYSGTGAYGLWNPATNLVTSVPELPTINHGDRALVNAVVTGSHYVNCGYSNNVASSVCVIYNLVSGQHSLVMVGGEKYGGCTVEYGDDRHILWIGGNTDTVILVDTMTRTYSVAATMPETRIRHSCAKLGHTIVICGGGSESSTTTSSCATLDTPSMKWGSFPSMLTPRRSFQMVNWDGKLMAIGGVNNGDTWLSSIEVFTFEAWCSSWQIWNKALPRTLALFGASVFSETY